MYAESLGSVKRTSKISLGRSESAKASISALVALPKLIHAKVKVPPLALAVWVTFAPYKVPDDKLPAVLAMNMNMAPPV